MAVTQRNLIVVTTMIVLLTALYFRMSGLFRGLGYEGIVYHPDEAKQVLAFLNFYHGKYIRYVGSLFYDGYPYGLNHLDEYLLRAITFFFDNDAPGRDAFYYIGRSFRLLYSFIVIGIGYYLVKTFTVNRLSSLLGLLLLSISPLCITVAHFATGDIGVDLFCAICFLLLYLYIVCNQSKIFLLLCGIAIGAAFSAKYNGLLIAIVPLVLLVFEYFKKGKLADIILNLFVLGGGAIVGTLLFTPNLLIDFQTSVENIFKNFTFIKNYNVPSEILAKSWFERATLGLQKNCLYIIGSLSYVLFFVSLLGIYIFGKRCLVAIKSEENTEYLKKVFLFGIALFPVVIIFISLTGKYSVQPFHFSYLQLPLIFIACVVFTEFSKSTNKYIRYSCYAIVGVVIVEFGLASYKDNFFWRHEDNKYYAENFTKSIYSPDALAKRGDDKIRSLYLESPKNASVFRNRKIIAEGPDAQFWNDIEVAPVPQIANNFGRDWIFVNGPSFPKNDRMIFVNGKAHGLKIKRNIVLPFDQKIIGIGVRNGSYATEAKIKIGTKNWSIQLEAHQQKILPLNLIGKKDNWSLISRTGVQIIPLEVDVPYGDIWITLLTNTKEYNLYQLFGGGQDGFPDIPVISAELESAYLDSLSKMRYLETPIIKNISVNERIAMWGVALTAGHYKLIAEVEGLNGSAIIEFAFEDARAGATTPNGIQTFNIRNGIQTIEYAFTKTFSPYQIKIIVSGITGNCKILSFKLYPDYKSIFADFRKWHETKKSINWISRD